jgi:hypothetical protein
LFVTPIENNRDDTLAFSVPRLDWPFLKGIYLFERNYPVRFVEYVLMPEKGEFITTSTRE